MKPNQYLKLCIILILILSFGLTSKTLIAQNQNSSQGQKNEDVNMTIDNKTTEENFKEISEMLEDYGVKAIFSKVQRTDDGELTGLKIELQTDGGQQTSSQISSNRPIGKISFGLRQGRLFIDQGNGGMSMFAFQSPNGQQPFGFLEDSIFADRMQQMRFFTLDNLFGEQGDNFNFSQDSMAIDKFQNKFFQFFKDPNAQSDVFSWMEDPYTNSGKRYRFVDDPQKEKIIIIDGETSDFKTLDRLAKAEQLDKVDLLKPETAMSLYGKKAKDGAIIATTKKE